MSNQQPNPNDSIATDVQLAEMCQITIPNRIGTKIETRIKGTEFDSVDEYVTFVLESVLRQLDEQDDGSRIVDRSEDHETNPEDSEAIQGRLESLGYL